MDLIKKKKHALILFLKNNLYYRKKINYAHFFTMYRKLSPEF